MRSSPRSPAPTGEGTVPSDDPDSLWTIGPLVLGSRSQATDILTLGHSAQEVAALVDGPPDLVREFALRVGRR